MPTCDICGREFSTERGLIIHKARAHGKSKESEKESGIKPLTEFMESK